MRLILSRRNLRISIVLKKATAIVSAVLGMSAMSSSLRSPRAKSKTSAK